MSDVRIAIISESRIFRDGLKALLGHTFLICAEAVATFDTKDWDEVPDLVLVDQIDEDKEAAIEEFSARFPNTYLVFLPRRLTRERIVRTIQAGAHGVLAPSLSRDALIHSLRLVLAGQVVIPSLVIDLDPETLTNPATAAGERDDPMTPRERQILTMIVQGASNKIIAHALGIRVPTVKFHIKALMRKVGAANRTQIAVWAKDRGYGAHEADASSGTSGDRTPALALLGTGGPPERTPFTGGGPEGNLKLGNSIEVAGMQISQQLASERRIPLEAARPCALA